MNNELVRYAGGGVAVPRHDRGVARVAKGYYDEARMVALKSDAVMAVAGHIMQNVTELDQLRRTLAGDDIALNMVLGEIEQNAIRAAGKLQRDMFGWGA